MHRAKESEMYTSDCGESFSSLALIFITTSQSIGVRCSFALHFMKPIRYNCGLLKCATLLMNDDSMQNVYRGSGRGQ